MPRRTFLRGLGITLGLPMLECMTPVFARAAQAPMPKRMLVIANNLGVLPKNFFPTTTGRNYALSPYLEVLAEVRNEFSVFSGLSHPAVTGGHSTDNCFLTSARGAFKAGFRNSISLDQYAAEKLGQVTRFPSLNLGVNIEKANRSLSWTRDGVLLPAEDSATALFNRMFVQGSADEVKKQLLRLKQRGSILDTLNTEAGRFSRTLGSTDKARLDQYLTSVREVELRLQVASEWEQRPKPVATQPAPSDINDSKLFFEKFDLMLSIAQLAFESDSTRIVTLMVDAFKTPVFSLPGQKATTETYHNLSHHGQNEEKVKQLEAADRQHMALLRKLIGNLAAKSEGGQRLLDRTMVLYGSNLGDANIHDNTNLPILLAGGGLQHGQHLAFKRDNNKPLSNLFVTMLQNMGIETDTFGSNAGTLNELKA
jgi:lambda repressor-like predicted transcriptional regulator